jgi:hypothetical protein
VLEFGVSEPFNDRQHKCKGLSTSSSVSCEEVLSLMDGAESLLLNWVKTFDTFLLEDFDGFLTVDEVLQ